MTDQPNPVYKAKDGSDHATAKAATAHNNLLDAATAYNEACKLVSRALGSKALTADGQHFEPRFADYYFIANRHSNALPQVVAAHFPYHEARIEVDEHYTRFIVRRYDCDRKDYIALYIDELYSTEKAASEACLNLCDERMIELAGCIAERKQRHAQRFGGAK